MQASRSIRISTPNRRVVVWAATNPRTEALRKLLKQPGVHQVLLLVYMRLVPMLLLAYTSMLLPSFSRQTCS